jgi:hypothetical protein
MADPFGTNSGGPALVGNVGGKTVSVTATPTVTTTASYGANFVVGGLLTFTSAFTNSGSGILQDVVVTIGKIETSGFTFIPFSAPPTNTTWTDNAVAAINAADVAKIREPISLSMNSQLGTCTVAYAQALAQAMTAGTTLLTGILLANATLTNQFTTTNEVSITVKILQDL